MNKVLLAAVLWGTLGPCFAWLGQQGVSAPQVAIWRAGLASLALAIFLALTQRALVKVKPRHLPFFAVYGLVSVAIFFVVYTRAIQLSGVAVGVTLLYTAPAWVALMGALFLGEKPRWVALALTFVGAALVAGVHDPSAMRANAAGLLAGVASGLTYATLGIFGRKAFALGYRPAQTMLYTLAFGWLFLLAFYGLPPAPAEGALPVLVYAGLVPTALSFLLYTSGLEQLGDAGRASLLATIEPVVGMILGYVVLNQAVSPTQLAGAACIVGGVVVLR